MVWSQGWYSLAQQCPSPNFGMRSRAPDLIVIHNISLPPFEYGSHSAQTLFQNQIDAQNHSFFSVIEHLRVSSHFVIERDGGVYQCVSCDDAAYHAGVSSFHNEAACNGFSIGIELEGCDFEPFELVQYDSLLKLIAQLQQQYPIRAITGHQHIAPSRKTDPGHFFDWVRLQEAGIKVDFNETVITHG